MWTRERLLVEMMNHSVLRSSLRVTFALKESACVALQAGELGAFDGAVAEALDIGVVRKGGNLRKVG
jgi:hypothetical protein